MGSIVAAGAVRSVVIGGASTSEAQGQGLGPLQGGQARQKQKDDKDTQGEGQSG